MAWKQRVINLLLNRLSPSGTALLDWLKPHIDDSLLEEIAAVDYGFEAEEHFEALKLIRDHQQIPVPLRWVPREVLELMRYSEPDDPQHQSPLADSKGTRGHLIRAFCCAVLLKAADEPETQEYTGSENDTLIQMIASAIYLGREATESALRFLSWRTLRMPLSDNEYPFFALGLLLLCAALFEPGQEGTHLKLLADWVVREETRVWRKPMALLVSEDWLLGLTLFDQRHEVWRIMAQEVLLDPTKGFPSPASAALRGIAQRLTPDTE